MNGQTLRCYFLLSGAEDRVKGNEQIERMKLEGEYQTKVTSLASELERVRWGWLGFQLGMFEA